MADYKAYILGENEIGFWDNYITRSSNGTIFHKFEWLKAAEEHSKMKLLPVAVSKGNHIVCLLPLFQKKKYGFKILLSPPNTCAIPYLGPILNIPSSNRYNFEQTYIDSIDEIMLFAEKSIGFDYLRLVHTPDIIDMRPYFWKNYYVQPNYTYTFDLTAKNEELYNSFHSSTKNAIKKALDNKDIVISRDTKYTRDILSLVRQRYAAQKRKFKVSDRYFDTIMSSSLSENIESIAIIHKDRTIAGDITLTDQHNAYAWIGSVSREDNFPGVGELVLWEEIKELTGRGFTTYDFVGANTKHIRKHKAKYGAQLVDYFVVHKTSMKGKIALDLMNVYGKDSDD